MVSGSGVSGVNGVQAMAAVVERLVGLRAAGVNQRRRRARTVGVEHLGLELDHGRFVGVVLREREVQLERPALPASRVVENNDSTDAERTNIRNRLVEGTRSYDGLEYCTSPRTESPRRYEHPPWRKVVLRSAFE